MGITNLNEAFEFEIIFQREFSVLDKNDTTKFYAKLKFETHY